MLRLFSVVVISFSLLFFGCQNGQVAPQGDSPEGGVTAPTNEAVQVIPSVSDSEIEQFATAVVNAEEDGIESEDLEGMAPYIKEVELTRDRYIQIQRGIQLDAEIHNSVQEKIDEIRRERT